MSPSIEIVCPSCGFTGQAPPSRIPARSVQLNCNQCKQQFTFDGAVAHQKLKAQAPPVKPKAPQATPAAPVSAAPTSEDEMPDIPLSSQTVMSGFGELLSEAWGVFKDRFLRLLGLYILMVLPIAVIGILAAVMIPASDGSMTVVIPFVLIAATVLTLGIGWIMAAVHSVIVDADLSFGGSLKRGWDLVWSFLWLYTLLGIIVMGASVFFLIPGIIFAVFFLFSGYIIAAEGDKGMAALLKSRAYIRGYGLPVFINLLIFTVLYILASIILAFIPILGNILSFLLGIFALVFYYVIYMDLRGIKGAVKPDASGSFYLLVGLAGIVIGFVAPFLFM